jgi:hypothetical protein
MTNNSKQKHGVQQKQQVLLGLVTFWVLVALLVPIIVFCLTLNPVVLSFFSTLAPPVFILHRITKTLFPPSDNETMSALTKRHNKRKVLI